MSLAQATGKLARLAVCLMAGVLLACDDGRPAPQAAAEASPFIAAPPEEIIIECNGDCANAAASVRSLGGTVTHQFHNVAGFAASLPAGKLLALSRLPGINSAGKDVLQAVPKPTLRLGIDAAQIVHQSAYPDGAASRNGTISPNDFSYDTVLTGAAQLHSDGNFGGDVIVAVIDSGAANNAEVVPALAGTIIGGESFIDDPAEPSATSTRNDEHGTWVATMIAGHGAFALANDSPLAQAVSTFQPESVSPQADGTLLVPMLGAAPEAKIYAMKIFAAEGDGAPRSRTLAALDRALTLKRNFNAGIATTPVGGDGSEGDPYVYDALNIQVVNVSLGGPTLYAGRSLEDLLIAEMLDEGIVVVAAAGNEGFAAMTGASPGAAVPALTVGAANVASHERILRELQLGPGGGLDFRPTDNIQVADFSSRGPTADGRPDPDLIANGFAVFVQGTNGDTALVSGTSFSAPTVAGAAALLFRAAPQSSAAAIRAALIESANPDLVGGAASNFDQGNGFLDVPAALTLLQQPGFDPEPPRLVPPAPRPQEVADAIENLGITLLELEENGGIDTSLRLMPGQVVQFFIETPRDARSLTVELTQITPELPPEQQNKLFGDDIGLTVVDAPLSFNETRVHEFLSADSTFVIDSVQTGLMRVALMGDWTNAGAVQANLRLNLITDELPRASFQGRLGDGQADEFQLRLPEGINALNVELAWRGSWAVNPAHDIDIIVIDPAGEPNFDGATLASPERLTITDPAPGVWTLLVDGFMLHGFDDRFLIRVTDQDERLLVTDD